MERRFGCHSSTVDGGGVVDGAVMLRHILGTVEGVCDSQRGTGRYSQATGIYSTPPCGRPLDYPNTLSRSVVRDVPVQNVTVPEVVQPQQRHLDSFQVSARNQDIRCGASDRRGCVQSMHALYLPFIGRVGLSYDIPRSAMVRPSTRSSCLGCL